jgi:transcriptional regulator with XRE-family HTH domain
VLIGDRLQALREEKQLSQGDIEKRTGLFRCYISRVENGHTVPAIETLEKMARALEVPMYQLFYDGEDSVLVNFEYAGGLNSGEPPRANAFADANRKIGLRQTALRVGQTNVGENVPAAFLDLDFLAHGFLIASLAGRKACAYFLSS